MYCNTPYTHLLAQMVKNLLTMQETKVWLLGQEDSLEKGMATHSRILAWRIPWTEEPSELQSVGSQRVWHDRAFFTNTKQNPTGALFLAPVHFSTWCAPINLPGTFNTPSTVRTSVKTPFPHPHSIRWRIPAQTHLPLLWYFFKLKLSASTTRFQISQKQGQSHGRYSADIGWMTELQIISQRCVWMLTIVISVINSQMLHCYPLFFFLVFT